MMYPTLPIYVDPPKRQQESYSYTPMPVYSVPYSTPRALMPSEAGSNVGLFTTLLIVFLSVFVLWDGLATYCNFGMMLKFFGLGDVKLIIAAVFFFVSAGMKLFTVIVGALTLITPKSQFLYPLEVVAIITILVNTAGFIYSLVLSVNVLMPGTLGGMLFDYILHFGTAGFSALLWKETPHLDFAWVLVPQSRLRY